MSAKAVVQAGTALQIVAAVSGATNKAVTYTTDGGVISSGGVFSSAQPGTYQVTATSVEDPTKSATTEVSVHAPAAPAAGGVAVKAQAYVPPANPVLSAPPLTSAPVGPDGKWTPAVAQWLTALYARVGGANGTVVQTVNGKSGAVSPTADDYSTFYLGITATAVNSARLGGEVPGFYAADAAVVHLVGNETINGVKVFSQPTSGVSFNLIKGLSNAIPLVDSPSGDFGVGVFVSRDDHSHPVDTSREPALGNPASNGMSLVSTVAGVRSWAATGSVTSVSIATANGFAGTVANASTTPVITLTTSVTGILKGNGTAISAATAGTDYVAPGGALGTPSSGNLTNCTFPTLNQNTTGSAATITGTTQTVAATWSGVQIHTAAAYFAWNSGGTYPSNANFGLAFGRNFSSGGSECDIWNTNSIVQAGFVFRQLTGASAQKVLATLNFSGLDLPQIGQGLRVAEGSNAKQGVANLALGTVTVANTSVTATSRIFLTIQSPSGVVGSVYISARVAGTSFTISSTSGADASVVAWEIFEVG